MGEMPHPAVGVQALNRAQAAHLDDGLGQARADVLDRAQGDWAVLALVYGVTPGGFERAFQNVERIAEVVSSVKGISQRDISRQALLLTLLHTRYLEGVIDALYDPSALTRRKDISYDAQTNTVSIRPISQAIAHDLAQDYVFDRL